VPLSIEAFNGGDLAVSDMAPDSGTIAVGVGSTAIAGTGFAQSATGTLSLSVGGKATGQYGVLSALSGATLAGTLNVSLVNGYSPTAGDSISLLAFGSRTGQFSTVNVANLPQESPQRRSTTPQA
jgi:hypothetical protein